MDKVEFIKIEGVEHAIIDHGNEQFTSMLKSTYEATLASELSNPSTPQAGE